jgi:hypothetical protein
MVEEPSHVKQLSLNHVCKIGLMSPRFYPQFTHRVATAAFWRTFHRWGERGARQPPFSIFTIMYKVAVYGPAERADTLPLFHLYPLCTLWFHLALSYSKSVTKCTKFLVNSNKLMNLSQKLHYSDKLCIPTQ